MKSKKTITIFLIILSTIVFIRPSNSYVLTLLKSFIFQFMIGYLILGIVWLYYKKWHIASVSCFASIILGIFLFLHIDGKSDTTNKEANFSIAHFNVLKFNNDHATIIKSALQTNADFISFQEVDYNWARDLQKSLHSKYPFSKIVAQESCCHGLAVFSKHPFSQIEVVYIENFANIKGTLCFNNQEIEFFATHTAAPISKKNYRSRNNEIDTIAQNSKNKTGPQFVLGDFNAVPWDKTIKKFKQTSQLKDSRKSMSATFPRFLGKFGIPIDYIFHSTNIECIAFKSIYNSSSDHAGILGTYYITI